MQNEQSWNRFDTFAQVAFWVSACFLVFLSGMVFVIEEWPPSQRFAGLYKTVRTIVAQQLQTRPTILGARRHAGDGVTRHDPARAYPGLTLLQGWFAEGAELRLVDMAGNTVHRWPADFFDVWPDPSHVIPESNVPRGPYNYHTQGMALLPDGSVVFNFGAKGTVKLDKCGTVQWTVDRMTHHSITANPDGSFWIPAKGDVRAVPAALMIPGVSREDLMASQGWYEDRLLLVDANGAIREEISVLQALFAGGFERELFDASYIDPLDPTHVNDIEVVNAALARKIDGAHEGDLLISIRQMHMLAILDRGTGRIEWHHAGPWIRQHDPEITDQGTIEVFNNACISPTPRCRPKIGLSLNRTPGSNVISLDPATGRISILYPPPGGESFHTPIMGTHQILPNGNRLITESLAGRVFEVDGRGDIVWEFVKPYDDQHAALIESAIRYSDSYLTVQDWDCPEDRAGSNSSN